MKIAVVGSSRGIGLEFVKQLSAENEVYAFCRTVDSSLKKAGAKTIVADFDVTDSQSMARAFQKVKGVTFDWVLVVAGILSEEDLSEWSDESITQQFLVNSLGALNAARIILPQLSSGGKIGFLTSRMGSIADNTSGGYYGYRMSKAALNAGAKSLSQDLKSKNITVLLLHPGYVKTDMTGHTGQIEPKESVEGLVRIMKSKNLDQTGTFWHTNGESLPW